jgi:hypothetical protein
MRGLTILIILMSIVGIFVMTGCNEEDILAPDVFAPPTNLRALSRDGEVTLYWNASLDATLDEFVGYRIMTRQGSILVDSTQVGKTAVNHTVQSLTNGTTYTFTVCSVKDNGDVSTNATLSWGPTRRFLTAARIYEFESSNPSGLQFSTASVYAFSSASPDNRSLVDLWIDGRSNSTPLLKSPHDQTISTGWHTTYLAETAVSDMNTQVDVPTLTSSSPLVITASRVYFARTSDNHYARFQVSAVQGTYPNRYVDITIAYNIGTGAWAKQ